MNWLWSSGVGFLTMAACSAGGGPSLARNGSGGVGGFSPEEATGGAESVSSGGAHVERVEPASAGAESNACPATLAMCGGACVDLAVNRLHCGQCDHACSESEVCEGGSCFEQKLESGGAGGDFQTGGAFQSTSSAPVSGAGGLPGVSGTASPGGVSGTLGFGWQTGGTGTGDLQEPVWVEYDLSGECIDEPPLYFRQLVPSDGLSVFECEILSISMELCYEHETLGWFCAERPINRSYCMPASSETGEQLGFELSVYCADEAEGIISVTATVRQLQRPE